MALFERPLLKSHLTPKGIKIHRLRATDLEVTNTVSHKTISGISAKLNKTLGFFKTKHEASPIVQQMKSVGKWWAALPPNSTLH